jgi:hypothetical protein
MQDRPKFFQIGNFGLKIYHLATLVAVAVVDVDAVVVVSLRQRGTSPVRRATTFFL